MPSNVFMHSITSGGSAVPFCYRRKVWAVAGLPSLTANASFGSPKDGSVLCTRSPTMGIVLAYSRERMAGPLFKKILVPVDFSRCSEEAFRVALQLEEALDAELTVMHVIDVNAVETFNRLGLLAVPSDAAEQRRRLRHHARLKMRQLLKSLPGSGSIRRIVAEGTPFVEIGKFARTEGIDLIVLGSYGGRSDSMDRIFFGATADKVVRTAGCAVLAVPLLRQKPRKDILL